MSRLDSACSQVKSCVLEDLRESATEGRVIAFRSHQGEPLQLHVELVGAELGREA